MILASGGDLAKAVKSLAGNEPLELEAGGRYPGAYVVGHKQPLLIVGNGAVFTGQVKLENVGPVEWRDFASEKSPGHGMMVVGCPSLTLLRPRVREAHVNGILTARVFAALIEDGEAEGLTGHGLYFSEKGGNYRLVNGTYRSAARTGVHVNSHPGRSVGLDIRGVDAQGPTAGLQVAGVTNGHVEGNTFRALKPGRSQIVAWCDDGGRAFGCRNLDMSCQPGTYAICSHCSGIKPPPGAVITRPH